MINLPLLITQIARRALKNQSPPSVPLPLSDGADSRCLLTNILSARPITMQRYVPGLVMGVLLLTFTLSVKPVHVAAQNNLLLTLAVNGFQETNQSFVAALDDFEIQNPGVQIQVVSVEPLLPPQLTLEGIEVYLDNAQRLASSGDVVQIVGGLTPVATRVGLFLNLEPLATPDPEFNEADYRDSAWQAFRWDNGLWALPSTVAPVNLFYDPVAFDTLGLAYPTASWTLADLEQAATTLETAFVTNVDLGVLATAATGASFTSTTFPPEPVLNTPDLLSALMTLANMQRDGTLTRYTPDLDVAPLLVGQWGIRNIDQGNTLLPAPLPGGRVAVDAIGYAVSGGTRAPEVAYRLARFLAERPELALSIGMLSARVDRDPSTLIPISEDDMRYMDELLVNFIPPRDLMFSNAFDDAVARVIEGVAEADALAEAEITAQEAIASLTEIRREVVLNTPEPLIRETNDISLTFAVDTGSSNLANTQDWQRVFDEFTTADQAVDLVELSIPDQMNMRLRERQDFVLSRDCGYIRYLSDYLNRTSDFLDLRPLIASDSVIDVDDLIGDVLGAITMSDGSIITLPASLEPAVIGILPALFEQASIPLPEQRWSINEWMSMVSLFQTATDATQPIISPQVFPSDPLQLHLLITLYGGVLYDEAQGMLSVNDPATIEAIRQVLDLAKDGDLAYFHPTPLEAPIILTNLNELTVTDDGTGVLPGPLGTGNLNLVYSVLAWPTGGRVVPYAYDVTGFFISSETQHREACYRLISLLSQQVELFGGMPAYNSLIDTPMTIATRAPALIDFYRHYIEITNRPDALRVRTLQQRQEPLFFWFDRLLMRAFDRYVQEDANLEEELAEAQRLSEEIVACVGEINPDDANYAEQVNTCGQEIDTTLFQ